MNAGFDKAAHLEQQAQQLLKFFNKMAQLTRSDNFGSGCSAPGG
jgi:hypothetical protein